MSRRRPSTVMRCTQVRRPDAFTSKNRPSPSRYFPGATALRSLALESRLLDRFRGDFGSISLLPRGPVDHGRKRNVVPPIGPPNGVHNRATMGRNDSVRSVAANRVQPYHPTTKAAPGKCLARLHGSTPPAMREMPALPYESAVGGAPPAEGSYGSKGEATVTGGYPKPRRERPSDVRVRTGERQR